MNPRTEFIKYIKVMSMSHTLNGSYKKYLESRRRYYYNNPDKIKRWRDNEKVRSAELKDFLKKLTTFEKQQYFIKKYGNQKA